MSEANGTIPTTVTRKRKRGSGFRYSSKKALQRSRLSKEISKGGVLELGSARKALTYPSELMSEIGVISLAGCSSDHLGLHPYSQLMKIQRTGLRQALEMHSRTWSFLTRLEFPYMSNSHSLSFTHDSDHRCYLIMLFSLYCGH
jgi:hypothetical protein